VVTAEHCISRTTGQIDPNSIAIGVDREGDVETNHITRVSRILKHSTEDIALLLLARPSTVAPVQRATSSEIADALRVELVGYGNTDPAGTIGFGTKRQVNVPMQQVRKSPGEDLTESEAILGFNSFTEFVAGRKGSAQDSCNGDSGGPAYVMLGDTRKLAGATSRASDERDDNCGDGGIYVRVDAVSDWIDETIASLS
jgi:endonuclease G